jgi:hypothetical protein
MDMFRAAAIFVEVVLLMAITVALLLGVRVILFDIGLRPKYKNMVNAILMVVGVIAATFFIVHLAAFYPAVR